MNAEQKALARHALGLPNKNKRSYRNRFVSYTANPLWDEMVKAGEATFVVNTYYLRREGADAALEAGETLDPEDFP